MSDAPAGALKARRSDAFPKRCAACGRVYASEQAYLQETAAMADQSGGIRQVAEADEVFLEVFRNCVCGSTLLADFDCRRDLSPRGDRRRQLFDACLRAMTAGGIVTEEARTMLRRLIRNDV